MRSLYPEGKSRPLRQDNPVSDRPNRFRERKKYE